MTGDTEGLNKNERKMNEMRWTEIEDGGKEAERKRRSRKKRKIGKKAEIRRGQEGREG